MAWSPRSTRLSLGALRPSRRRPTRRSRVAIPIRSSPTQDRCPSPMRERHMLTQPPPTPPPRPRTNQPRRKPRMPRLRRRRRMRSPRVPSIRPSLEPTNRTMGPVRILFRATMLPARTALPRASAPRRCGTWHPPHRARLRPSTPTPSGSSQTASCMTEARSPNMLPRWPTSPRGRCSGSIRTTSTGSVCPTAHRCRSPRLAPRS